MNSVPHTGTRAVTVSGMPGERVEAWLISPELLFKKGETYSIKISFRNGGKGGASSSIGIGNTPTSYDIGKTFLWNISSVDNIVYNEVEIIYTHLDNNTKYLGIVVVSFGGRVTENIFDTFSIEKKTLSNQEFEKDFVSIVPNPVGDFLKLELKNEVSSNLSLSIYNSLGKLILKEEKIEPNNLINISHISSGLYFAKIEDDTGRSLVKKIIKK